MLQRDYIQRLIREFMAALERMLEKKEVEVRREKIKELYNQYVGPYAFYSIATIEDVMKAMAGILVTVDNSSTCILAEWLHRFVPDETFFQKLSTSSNARNVIITYNHALRLRGSTRRYVLH